MELIVVCGVATIKNLGEFYEHGFRHLIRGNRELKQVHGDKELVRRQKTLHKGLEFGKRHVLDDIEGSVRMKLDAVLLRDVLFSPYLAFLPPLLFDFGLKPSFVHSKGSSSATRHAHLSPNSRSIASACSTSKARVRLGSLFGVNLTLVAFAMIRGL